MRMWHLPRHYADALTFEGDFLFTMDDRQWLGMTPNWWELSLYRTAQGQVVLGSVYYQKTPRRRTLYGALLLPSLDAVAHCLRAYCGAPEVIIEALLARGHRCLNASASLQCAPTAALHDMPPVTPPAPVHTSCLWHA